MCASQGRVCWYFEFHTRESKVCLTFKAQVSSFYACPFEVMHGLRLPIYFNAYFSSGIYSILIHSTAEYEAMKQMFVKDFAVLREVK